MRDFAGLRRRRRSRLVGHAVLAAALAAMAAADPPSVLVPFELADQFDRRHDDSELGGRVVMLVASGRGGSRYQGAWTAALRQALASRGGGGDAVVLEAADLRGVPFFMRRSVKKRFPPDPERRVLMDWKGVLARAYALDPDLCSILLFDRRGRLVQRAAGGDVEAPALAAIVRRLEAELRSPPR